MSGEQLDDKHLVLLGEIKGIVQGLKDGQEQQAKRFDRIDTRMDGIDNRMRVVEQRSAVAGAVSGGAMAVGTALIIEGLRHWLRGGGTGQ